MGERTDGFMLFAWALKRSEKKQPCLGFELISFPMTNLYVKTIYVKNYANKSTHTHTYILTNRIMTTILWIL